MALFFYGRSRPVRSRRGLVVLTVLMVGFCVPTGVAVALAAVHGWADFGEADGVTGISATEARWHPIVFTVLALFLLACAVVSVVVSVRRWREFGRESAGWSGEADRAVGGGSSRHLP